MLNEEDMITTLRTADEHTVAEALESAYITTPISEPTELLEFFNRMLDVLIGEDDQDK